MYILSNFDWSRHVSRTARWKEIAKVLPFSSSSSYIGLHTYIHMIHTYIHTYNTVCVCVCLCLLVWGYGACNLVLLSFSPFLTLVILNKNSCSRHKQLVWAGRGMDVDARWILKIYPQIDNTTACSLKKKSFHDLIAFTTLEAGR